MFPPKDENPTEITPFVNVMIIAANVLVWVMVQNAGAGQECSANPTFSRVPSPKCVTNGAAVSWESMFPLKDENPTEITPFVTVIIIAANVLVWVLVQNAGAGQEFLESLCVYGAIPGEITGVIPAGRWVPLGPVNCRIGGMATGALFSSMFMHGSWLHLLGNMWFLWVFGNNIEDSMGHLRFIVFYLLTGLLASGAHILTSFSSGVPMVGASGAISGIMGAYVVLYPRVRVQTLIIFFYFIRIVALPAVIWLGLWFAIQLLQGAAAGSAGTGVAFWAHIGGFAAGVVLIKLFERPKLVAAKRDHRRLTRDELPPRERW